jgi:hypothetical protein
VANEVIKRDGDEIWLKQVGGVYAEKGIEESNLTECFLTKVLTKDAASTILAAGALAGSLVGSLVSLLGT